LDRQEELLTEIRDLLASEAERKRVRDQRRDAQVEASLAYQRAHRRLVRIVMPIFLFFIAYLAYKALR